MKDFYKKPGFWIAVVIIGIYLILWYRYRKCVSSHSVPMGDAMVKCNFFTGKIASSANPKVPLNSKDCTGSTPYAVYDITGRFTGCSPIQIIS